MSKTAILSVFFSELSCTKNPLKNAPKKAFLTALLLIILLLFIPDVLADDYTVIQFPVLPESITTNIPAFPVSGITPDDVNTIYVNDEQIPLDSNGFFTVVDTNQTINEVTLKFVYNDEHEETYSRQILYDPDFSTAGKELLYANIEASSVGGVIVIDIRNDSFLGVIKDQRIKGIRPDGSEIVMTDGWRWSTETHQPTERLPYYGSYLVFSHDNQFVYYRDQLDSGVINEVYLESNQIVRDFNLYSDFNLPGSFDGPHGIDENDEKLVFCRGYINLHEPNDSKLTLDYCSEMRSLWGDLVIDPTGTYVLTSSYSAANGRLIIRRAEDGNVIAMEDWDDRCDYAGDIVFSKDGKTAYAGFGGNPAYNEGRIIIVDMNSLNISISYLVKRGARSLAVSDCREIYTFARYDWIWGTRVGIAALVPKCAGKDLVRNKFYCATNQCYSTSCSPMVSGRESIFYKKGTECIKESAPEYDTWVNWDRPCCWCYKKQCRGDINGTSFLGKPVTLCDLGIFKQAFNESDEILRQSPELICADLNHAAFLGKRVTLSDLAIFKEYFNKIEELVPCCDLDEECFFTEEDKYKLWTN